MAESRRTQRAIDGREERSPARAAGALLIVSAGFVALTLGLPHPSGGDVAVQVAVGSVMLLAGLLCWTLSARIPVRATHLILGLGAAGAGILIVASGVAAGGYGSVFVWTMLVAGYFFPRRIALAHLGWVLGVYAVTILAVASTAGYSPLTRWLSTAVSLTVVTMLTTEVVQRRARADKRARRFFDLSHDLLSTIDMTGRCVEVNAAWTDCLGYSAAEMQGRPLLDITHRDDLERATRKAVEVFRGKVATGLETRVRAKDGSWHWLRSTATYAADEKLVYARSSDITELKNVEAEREELLREVENLARSDTLTGLANRRALEEHLPREMAAARRSREPLWLAMVDIDRFKAYNDANGHLAGDTLLRDCAMAWDGVLRSEDTITRFGGEEFVALLPRCVREQAVAVVERLRAATPAGQTVSAGLACWDFAEPAEELIGRADTALYAAKERGRDRLVDASAVEKVTSRSDHR